MPQFVEDPFLVIVSEDWPEGSGVANVCIFVMLLVIISSYFLS